MDGTSATPYLSIAWASCPHWAVRESADIIDVIEQPAGQTCAVLIDVQGTGASPRRLGHSLMLEARSLLSGGVGADLAAHALSQQLHAWRDGQVGATILIASISASRCRAEIAGYGDATIASRVDSAWTCQEMRYTLAGHDPGASPDLRVLALDHGTTLLLSSDGVARTSGALLSLASDLNVRTEPAGVVDGVIAAAIARDGGRPSADMVSVAISISAERPGIAVERGHIARPVRAKAARQ